MAIFFYNIFLFLYKTGIRIAAMWNKKARQWVDGRKNIFDKIIKEVRTYNSDNIWVHCSSLGEFEQGRPVIERLKREYPTLNFIVTFFSPSGYEIRKNYNGAAWVFYLPLDSKTNAKEFIDMINPQLVIFVKYDYWFYYIIECKKRNIPLLMVSAIFRKEQPFFKWYGTLHRKMLKCFTHFFVQDKASFELLNSVGISNVTISGDTRFDRVTEIAKNFHPLIEVDIFCGISPVLICGSTWPSDEKIINEAIAEFPNLKVIIAPHEIHEEHLNQLKQIFPQAIFYSQLTPDSYRDHHSQSNILIIDNIGMLSRLYHYATITYIGGGFDKGIHNTLEPAVYGKPVIFGPNHKKFKEAIGLINAGGGIAINSASEFASHLKTFLSDQEKLNQTSKRSFDFVQNNKGATEKIMSIIQENRRFTK
jgi:3-deoxy-D-manno-octulosonic-acid transferase